MAKRKKDGQTTQWLKEDGQTTQWLKEKKTSIQAIKTLIFHVLNL
jgi:hypothetical protein